MTSLLLETCNGDYEKKWSHGPLISSDYHSLGTW
uniref:Uncharacterized protein n=1 Tax=Arundo donax TaxID=35708 RepID=A0A0A9ECK3_ARUDO